MNIYTVILHYGPVERTLRLHTQLRESDAAEADKILVFDNASPAPYPGAWMRSDCNLYWAGALEYVMRELAGQGASHVWFLNNDIVFLTRPPLVERVKVRLARAERLIGPVGVYSPAVTSNPYHPQMVELVGGQFRRVRYVDGIAPLISVDFWRAAGGVEYEDNPYGYGVDVWFSIQTGRCACACVVDHQVVMRHHYHSTAKEVSGFLEMAAGTEKDYLVQRMGPNFRTQLELMARDVQEFT